MKNSLMISLLFAVSACLAAAFFSGCETGGGTNALTVTPSSISVTNREAITLTVASGTNAVADSGLRDLSLPLEWRLGNALLGSITSQSGYSCVYVRNSRRGSQTITVRDQYGSEGSATVEQL